MEPLKGLILSGGKGTRLRPITHTSAKQLVPVANKPVLFYGIEAMAAAAIEEIGIVIAPDTGPEIERAVGDGSRFGVRVSYIIQDEPLGLAHAVLAAEAFLGAGLRVEPHIVRGWWKDTGRLEDMLEANRLILDGLSERVEGELIDSRIDGRVVVEPGARLERTVVRGPAIIGARSRLADCY